MGQKASGICDDLGCFIFLLLYMRKEIRKDVPADE